MAISETISCHCNESSIHICISFNDWIEVSDSYSTCQYPGAFTKLGLEQVEQIRMGSRHCQAFEMPQMQDIVGVEMRRGTGRESGDCVSRDSDGVFFFC